MSETFKVVLPRSDFALSIRTFTRYCCGDRPYSFLNTWQKYLLSRPSNLEIVAIFNSCPILAEIYPAAFRA